MFTNAYKDFPFLNILNSFQSHLCTSNIYIFSLSFSLQVSSSRGAWSGVPVASPVAASACGPMEIEALPRSPGGEKRRLVPG